MKDQQQQSLQRASLRGRIPALLSILRQPCGVNRRSTKVACLTRKQTLTALQQSFKSSSKGRRPLRLAEWLTKPVQAPMAVCGQAWMTSLLLGAQINAARQSSQNARQVCLAQQTLENNMQAKLDYLHELFMPRAVSCLPVFAQVEALSKLPARPAEYSPHDLPVRLAKVSQPCGHWRLDQCQLSTPVMRL